MAVVFANYNRFEFSADDESAKILGDSSGNKGSISTIKADGLKGAGTKMNAPLVIGMHTKMPAPRSFLDSLRTLRP